MLVSLAELKPSPWNPKKPFTKKELAALKKAIGTFGFKRSLCVCRDFKTGEGFFILDGNSALEILKEIGQKKVDCHIVENVTDEKTLEQFMAGYSVHKEPIYSAFADALGSIDFSDFTGLDFGKFSFDVNIDKVFGEADIGPEAGTETDTDTDTDGPEKKEKKHPVAAGTGSAAFSERQTQFFLTLPPDCVDKLRNFVKTKAYKTSKTEAIAEKIDAMNDTRFLENILRIVL